jgi:hypothetical protein
MTLPSVPRSRASQDNSRTIRASLQISSRQTTRSRSGHDSTLVTAGVHVSRRAGRSTTSAGGEFRLPDVTRASVRSRKTSFTAALRQVFVRRICDQYAGCYTAPTCSPIDAIFSSAISFMVTPLLLCLRIISVERFLVGRRFTQWHSHDLSSRRPRPALERLPESSGNPRKRDHHAVAACLMGR